MNSRVVRLGGASALFRSGVAIAALLVAPPVLADEGTAAEESGDASAEAEYEDAGEAIIVTARRREESSQDVPIALSVVSATTLEQTGNFTLNQVQQLVPSLQITGSNPRNSSINIRGLGANSSIAVDGLEYGVGFYVDGVYYGRPGQSQFDLIDLAQIEVLRGPQGTLFGKNTTAGALNISTREPSFSPEVTAEGTIGDYKYRQFRFSGSAPIVDNKVAVRLSGAYTKRDGFLTNLYDGKDAQDYENVTLRGQLLIKPSENVKVRLIGDYSQQKLGIILSVIDGYFTKFANGTHITNNIFDRAARTGYELPDQNVFSHNGNSNSPFQAKMKSYGLSGRIDWDLVGATLTSVTAYRWWDWFPKNDTDGTPLSINTKTQQENFQRQFSQELRIGSNGDKEINYVAGVFYFQQKVPGYQTVAFGKDFAEWNLNPATVPPSAIDVIDRALTDIETHGFSNSKTKSYAAFGQVDWRIADPLTLTVGLRYTHEDKTGEYRRYLAPGSGGDRTLLTAAQQAAYQINDMAYTAAVKADALSGMATLAYKVTPDVLLYGSYSRGNKSGGLNITAGGINRPVVDPETVDAFELGVKSQFLNGKATFNAAAFLTEIKDYQANVTEQVAGTTQMVQYISSIPKVRSKGVEADFNLSLSKWVNFGASAAYTDAQFVSFVNSPQSPERSNEGAIQDLSGRRLPGVPKFAYSTNLDVAQPLNDNLEVYGRADWNYRSSFNAASTLSAYGRIPSYGLLNARLGIRTSDGQIDLAFWARNLLDKKYYLGRNASTFGLLTATAGDPRTAGATIRVKW